MLLQELARRALSFANRRSANATPESGLSRSEQTNEGKRFACNIMKVQFASSFKILVNWVYDGTCTLQLLMISEILVAISDQSSTYLTSTPAKGQVNYCQICLDRPHTTSKYPQNTNPEALKRRRNCNFHNKKSNRANDRPIERSPMRQRGRGAFHNSCFSSSNRKRG